MNTLITPQDWQLIVGLLAVAVIVVPWAAVSWHHGREYRDRNREARNPFQRR